MFYCEPCRVKRSWPESIGKSYGKCEVCDNVRICNDRASSTLPLSEPTPLSEDGRFQELLARLQERLNRL